jgi:hypothetical protein
MALCTFVRVLADGGVVLLRLPFFFTIQCVEGALVGLWHGSSRQGWPVSHCRVRSSRTGAAPSSSPASLGSVVAGYALGALVSLQRGSSGRGKSLKVAGCPLHGPTG